LLYFNTHLIQKFECRFYKTLENSNILSFNNSERFKAKKKIKTKYNRAVAFDSINTIANAAHEYHSSDAHLGHIMRNKSRYELLQYILQGKIDSKTSPRRRRTSWLANLRTWFEKTSVKLFRSSTNKTRISMMITNILNGSAH
jgi:hypothetical protein